MTDEPLWIERTLIEAVHLDQLRTYGGGQGIRSEPEAIGTMLAVAAGEMSEAELAAWARENSEARAT